MKNILVISFNFPPIAKVSGLRASKFAKFLPEFGYNPLILTVDPRYYAKTIFDNLETSQNRPNIFRIPFLPLPAARTIIALLFPFFILFYVFKYRKILDAIYLVGSPYHPFVITPILTKILKLPVLLDFRDSWSMNYGYDGRSKNDVKLFTKLKQKIYFNIEKIALNFTSAASFSTPKLLEEYTHFHPKNASKYNSVLNGYDEDDFKGIQPTPLSSKKTIVVAGQFTIYIGNFLKEILLAIKSIPNLTLIYVGSEHAIIEKAVNQLYMADRAIIRSYQPYQTLLQIIAGSNFGLLSNGLANGLGTKIFDYMALKKPFLCLVPKGSIITDLFGDIEGVVISEYPHTREKVENGLKKLLKYKSFENESETSKYTRRNSTQKLSQILDSIIK